MVSNFNLSGVVKLLLVIALSCTAFAGQRTITGDIDEALGGGGNGFFTVEWPHYTNVGGTFVAASRKVVRVAAGAYTAFSLDSSADATPAFSYTITYNFGAAASPKCSWSIPAGSTSVTIVSIQTCPALPSTPGSSIALSAIPAGTNNYCLMTISSAAAWSNTCVIGGTNLTTAGRVGIVSAARTLTEDAGLQYDAVTDDALRVNRQIFIEAAGAQAVLIWKDADISCSGVPCSRFSFFTEADGSAMKWARYDDMGMFVDAVATIARASGNVLVGGTTDGGYRVDVQASGSAGYLRSGDITLIPIAIAALPGSPVDGQEVVVNDSSDGSCVNDGGALRRRCRYDTGLSAWVPSL